MDRPKTVLIVVILLGLNILISLPSMYLNVSNAPAELSRPVMLGFGAFMLLIQLGFLYLIFTGKNWGRIIYAVLTALGLLFSIGGPNPAGTHHQLMHVVHWYGVVVGIVVLILLFMPASNAWFKAQKSNA